MNMNMETTTSMTMNHTGMHMGGSTMNMGGSTMDMGGSTMDMNGMHGGMHHGDPTENNLHGMHMNHTDACGSMMGMMMFFHTGNCEYILFEAIRTTSAGEMGGACVVIFVLGLLYEGLKVFREYLLRRSLTNSNYGDMSNSFATDVTVVDGKSRNGSEHISAYNNSNHNPTPPKKSSGESNGLYTVPGSNLRRPSMLSGGHFIQTLLHMVQVLMSYFLMLVFMTYNAWLCIAIILGAGSGYFLFGWKRAIVVDVNEHCH